MVNSDIVLQVNTLGKCFKIYSNPWHRVLEWARLGKRTYHQPFWALQDISFEVKRGEFFGIVGQNGAGKSTLLKILSGVLQPTCGSYQLNGRLLSMLELGADFNPYLTGRENVFRTAEMLGFPGGYVQERIEQIAEFSELAEFFERPVRLYSSGMYSRLAFSLFVFLECDVLILDEVLAVGDIFFKQKCYARLEKLIAANMTIILVTHAMDAIQHYCDSVIVLDKGQKIYQGKAGEAIRRFHQLRNEWSASRLTPLSKQDPLWEYSHSNNGFPWPVDEVFTPSEYSGNGQARLIRFAICNEKDEPCRNFTQGEQASIYCEFRLQQNIGIPIIGLKITNQFNVLVHAKNSLHHAIDMPKQVHQDDYIRFCRRITLHLAPGEYVFGLVLATMHPDDYIPLDELDIDGFLRRRKSLYHHDQVGFFRILPKRGRWVKMAHGGICDLPGEGHVQLVSHT